MKSLSQDLFHKAVALMEQGRNAEAKMLFGKILRKEPNHLDANYLMGTLCAEDGEFARGEQLLRKALKMKPDSPYILNNLGNVYQKQSKDDEALNCYQKALKIKSDLPQAHCNIGVIYKVAGDLEGARKHFEMAEKLQPGMDKARAGLASLQERAGDYRKARKSLEKVVNSGERDVHTAMAFAEAVLHDDSSPTELKKALRIVDEQLSTEGPSRLSRTEMAKVYYLLGALNDQLKDYDQAFIYYEMANKKISTRYDMKKMRKSITAITENFTGDVLERSSTNAETGANLVFILGMPRSGSTLVEQILDSHPDVASLGECNYFAEILETISKKASDSPLSEEQVALVAQRYYSCCREQHPNAKVFTDKTLTNYLCLGQILQVFPEAKIVHCQRAPLDTCLSCYFHDFAGQYEFTNDLSTLGRYYRAYQSLMDHWRESLHGRLYPLSYEELIKEPKREIKLLLDYCDLKFNRACLKFYKNKRIVNTASYYQVRKPIYRSSVNRSQAYQRHLEPLMRELGDTK
jgi:tetratricopeptide (TPR) repeat protein